MRARVLPSIAVAVSAASLGVFVWVLTRADYARPARVNGHAADWWGLIAPIAWTATGAVLLWLRPRNRVGALILFVGTCQAISVGASAYGMYGVGIAEPQWPAARWIAFFGAPLFIPGLLPLLSVLPAIYPDGRLPDRRWRLPVASAALGIALLTVAMTGSGAYDDVAPGPPPLHLNPPAAVSAAFAVTMAASFLGGTAWIWVMSLVRLARARSPQRQQLAWLLCAVLPFFLVTLVSAWRPLSALLTTAVPVAIAVGVLRYQLLGITVVLRRGLVYAVLTATVIAAYLGATALAGSQMAHGAAPGIVAAALVAVGLTPLRERVQRRVDRLVYGSRSEPLRAVTRFADSVADTAEPQDLLPTVLSTVTSVVRAPGAAVVAPDGRALASQGDVGEGEQFTLRFGGGEVGVLHVTHRSPGEPYTDGDVRLLSTLAPQVAVVVRALDLAEALETERDRVLAATRAERDRLRRDLHDGLGPSLSGVGLGLQALDTALADRDESTAAELLARVRAEAGTAVIEVRRILDDLQPSALDEARLPVALRRLATSVAAGVPVDVDVADVPALPLGVEIAAYRIAQEALTNVARHAAASRAQLSLAAADGTLRVAVSDDGRGFTRDGEGVGMGSMRHRAEAVNGSLQVTTGGRGTTVVATLPIAAQP